MLERYAMKVARTVLRGGSGSNVTPLPDQRTPKQALLVLVLQCSAAQRVWHLCLSTFSSFRSQGSMLYAPNTGWSLDRRGSVGGLTS
jgi:hypothetical protein